MHRLSSSKLTKLKDTHKTSSTNANARGVLGILLDVPAAERAITRRSNAPLATSSTSPPFLWKCSPTSHQRLTGPGVRTQSRITSSVCIVASQTCASRKSRSSAFEPDGYLVDALPLYCHPSHRIKPRVSPSNPIHNWMHRCHPSLSRRHPTRRAHPHPTLLLRSRSPIKTSASTTLEFIWG